jgi:hypothetical protein
LLRLLVLPALAKRFIRHWIRRKCVFAQNSGPIDRQVKFHKAAHICPVPCSLFELALVSAEILLVSKDLGAINLIFAKEIEDLKILAQTPASKRSLWAT